MPQSLKYARILHAVAGQVWAMQAEKMQAMMEFLRFAAAGGTYTPEQVAARIGKAEDRSIAQRAGAVAVLPIVGVIGHRVSMLDEISGGGGFSIAGMRPVFHAAVNDDAVKAIVFDVESPGGVVGGVPEFAREIAAARERKPIIAVVNPLAASAGYWLAAAATEVVVSPSSDTGSVGVYSLHEDVSQYLEGLGIKEEFIHAGRYKVEGNPYEPLGDEARAHIQRRVDETYGLFVSDLAAFRGVSVAAVKDGYGEGRVFGAEESVERGMADRIGTLNETLARFDVGPLAVSPQAPQRSAHRRALAARRLALIEAQ